MTNLITLWKVREGNNPTLPNDCGKQVDASDFFGKISGWTWRSNLDKGPTFPLSNSRLDDFRGPRWVVAEVPRGAARLLGLSAGWHMTDISVAKF